MKKLIIGLVVLGVIVFGLFQWGVGFNNTYNINQNNSISYGSSFSTSSYDKIAFNDADNPDDANNDIYIKIRNEFVESKIVKPPFIEI